MKGRGVSTGIRLADLPPSPPVDETAPVAVVAAGQEDNSNSNTTVVERIGAGGFITRVPAETARRSHAIK
jgi:hypothetical protein